jgi:hypothetical protein
MNHLVILDRRAGELEKILSGVKCMLVKEIQPPQAATAPVNPGDSLYFLRDSQDRALRVKASVVRVFTVINAPDEHLTHTLKEFQPRLQLTEDQYNYWSTKKQVLLVEFTGAQKMDVIHVAPDKVTYRPDWIPFEQFSHIT